MQTERVIEADWTWTGEEFERDVQILITPEGRIEHVGPIGERPTDRLIDQAILPGMVNAHSHAFQRGLRGCGETFPDGSGSFWTWREAMYAIVERIDADTMYRLSRQAFTEMLACGITTVGEFHYLHHDGSGQGYKLDEPVLRAARDAGIRLVLLNVYYNTGGIGQPLSGVQKRFASASTDAYWEQTDKLAARLDPGMQTLGVAAHSIRAVEIDDIAALHRESIRRGMVFHMHVEEQWKEVEECMAVYGKRPMALLNDRLPINDRFTAVHGTHTDPEDMKRFAARSGLVCICPLTEGNLGDGIADVSGIVTAGGKICLGTDSNVRIGMAEELRWLEYVQRLRHETRGVCMDAAGSVARSLWNMATDDGAQSLGLRTGRIEPGYLGDFLVLDLTAPSLAGWTPETLLDSFIFGSGAEAVADVCIGGHWINKQPASPH